MTPRHSGSGGLHGRALIGRVSWPPALQCSVSMQPATSWSFGIRRRESCNSRHMELAKGGFVKVIHGCQRKRNTDGGRDPEDSRSPGGAVWLLLTALCWRLAAAGVVAEWTGGWRLNKSAGAPSAAGGQPAEGGVGQPTPHHQAVEGRRSKEVLYSVRSTPYARREGYSHLVGRHNL